MTSDQISVAPDKLLSYIKSSQEIRRETKCCEVQFISCFFWGKMYSLLESRKRQKPITNHRFWCENVQNKAFLETCLSCNLKLFFIILAFYIKYNGYRLNLTKPVKNIFRSYFTPKYKIINVSKMQPNFGINTMFCNIIFEKYISNIFFNKIN